jgi:hypothetical protein
MAATAGATRVYSEHLLRAVIRLRPKDNLRSEYKKPDTL